MHINLRKLIASVDVELMRSLFQTVAEFYKDPRQDESYKKKLQRAIRERKFSENSNEPELYIQNRYFTHSKQTLHYQLGAISSLANLRNGYWKLQGLSDH